MMRDSDRKKTELDRLGSEVWHAVLNFMDAGATPALVLREVAKGLELYPIRETNPLIQSQRLRDTILDSEEV